MRGQMNRLMDRRIGPPEWVHGGGGVDEGRGLGLRRASSRLGPVLPPFLGFWSELLVGLIFGENRVKRPR